MGNLALASRRENSKLHYRHDAAERAVRLAVSRDRARTKVLRMSQFGIVQMTRQRIRPSLKRTSFDECPACRASKTHVHHHNQFTLSPQLLIAAALILLLGLLIATRVAG